MCDHSHERSEAWSRLDSVIVIPIPPSLNARPDRAASLPAAEPASTPLVLLVGLSLLLVLVVLFALSLGAVLLVGVTFGR